MSGARLVSGVCACGRHAAHVPGRRPRCMDCLRADHGLTSTPADRFNALPRAERLARYALPRLGGQGVALPLDDAARRAWSATRDGSGLPPHPAPEVGARDAYAHEVPAGARRLAELAASLGWRGRVTYARGTTIHAKLGTPLRVVDSVAVRLWGPDGRRAVGVWHDRKAEEGWKWAPGELPHEVGVAKVVEWVRGDSEIDGAV